MHLLAGLQTDTRSRDNHPNESLCTLNFPAASAVSNKFKSTGPASKSHCTKAWQISVSVLHSVWSMFMAHTKVQAWLRLCL